MAHNYVFSKVFAFYILLCKWQRSHHVFRPVLQLQPLRAQCISNKEQLQVISNIAVRYLLKRQTYVYTTSLSKTVCSLRVYSSTFFKRLDSFALCSLATTDNPLFLCCVALSLLKLCFVGKTAATRKEKKKVNHVEEHVIEALNKTTAAIVGNISIYLN